MAAVTIRNLSEEAHRALKVRAAQHNRSAEAEMRAILEAAVRPECRLRLGTALSGMSRKIGLTNADVEAFELGRGARPAEPTRFESSHSILGRVLINSRCLLYKAKRKCAQRCRNFAS